MPISNAAEFKKRLAGLPVDKASKKRDPGAINQLCMEALYSISLHGDTISRHLAEAIIKARRDADG